MPARKGRIRAGVARDSVPAPRAGAIPSPIMALYWQDPDSADDPLWTIGVVRHEPTRTEAYWILAADWWPDGAGSEMAITASWVLGAVRLEAACGSST